MINWVVCDLDGTLYKHDDDGLSANPQTIKCINHLKSRDRVLFTFSTGRHYLNAINMLKNSGIHFHDHDFLVGLNGSQIYSFKQKSLICKKLINNKSIQVLDKFIPELERLYQHKYLIIFYGENNDIIFLKSESENFNKMVDDTLKFHGEDISDFKVKEVDSLKEVGNVFKCTIYIKDKEFDYPYLKEYLNKLAKNEFEITKSTTYLLELMPKKINKSVALTYLNSNFYDFNKNEILAFGDSLNDYEMFKFAGQSITRIDADEHLKAIATYVLDAEPSDFVLDGLELLIGD